ncbi:MAG: FkbM family methyltransferase, partial [Nostoc sp.]
MPEITLTNGMRIFYLRKEEVSTLSKQVQHYFRNGIEVHEGDTVFDVGANIGLFTLWTFQNCKQNVDIYAFEPIPAIFNVLKANAERFNPEKIKVFVCGL